MSAWNCIIKEAFCEKPERSGWEEWKKKGKGSISTHT
jgi:hypothetical protein